MSTKEEFKKILSLSKLFKGISYKGVNLDKVQSKDIREIVTEDTKIRRWLMVFLLLPLKIDGNIKKARVMYSVFDQNPSHIKFADLAMKQVKDKAEIKIQYNKIRPDIPRPRHFVFSIKNILFNKKIRLNIKYRIYLTLRTAMYVNYIDYCISLIGNKKLDMYISMYGGAGFSEAILNQLLTANNKDIALSCFQHGLVAASTPTDRFINYETTADYIFCWGEYNRDGIKRSNKTDKKLIICGNPLYSNRKKKSYNFKKRRKLVTIFLDPAQSPRLQSNIGMLKLVLPVLIKNGFEYQLKLHPGRQSTIKPFQNHFAEKLVFVNKPAEKMIEESYFCISTSSTVFAEGTFYGVPFLRYRAPEKSIPFYRMDPINNIFDDKKSFEKLLHKLMDEKEYQKRCKEMWSYADYYFSYCDKDVSEVYAKTIKKIIDKKPENRKI
ncbi:MAG: hypothetical protein KAS90_03505 [Candidatus Aenigmarchaeota archaeon]|nr:hypothetical protein [Candidatus Aenigmarchaeota archaeon]